MESEPEEAEPEPEFDKEQVLNDLGWDMSPPPRWSMILAWPFGALALLCLALTIMAQWFLWMVLGVALWDPWGGLIALPTLVTQIMFMHRRTQPAEAAC
jgi:hypothetical protein